MPTQGTLEGFAPTEAIQSLFLAVLPDPAASESIARHAGHLRDAHGLHGRRVDPSRYHVTLHFFGESSGPRPDLETAVRAAAGRIRSAPFEVVLDSAASFGRRETRATVLRGPDAGTPIHALWSNLRDACIAQGLRQTLASDFAPHVTIGYDPSAVAPQPIEPIAWIAREFVLVRSLRGQGLHDILARWPLGD